MWLQCHRLRSDTVKSARHADAFADAVERALEHAGDPAWLEAHSPLAAPYFLAGLMDAPSADALAGRGRALLAAMRDAARNLPDEQQRLLNTAFFDRRPSLNNAGVARLLSLSEATYYRHRATAIAALAEALNHHLAPAMQLTVPRARPLIGRDDVLARCLAALREGHSVSITGPGGLGKTSLGAHIAAHWPAARAFWFTVRPGLNDHLSSFAFALAHFLRRHGASQAWRQIVAEPGANEPVRLLGLLRHDLASLSEAPALLCVDESDLLRQDLRAHAQIIHTIEELSESTPVLLLGQQTVARAHAHHVLGGLPAEAAVALLAREGVTGLSPLELAELRAATRGNPAVLLLFAALYREGDHVSDVLRQLADAPSIEVLLSRMWVRLDDDERALLAELAVFRGPAPADAFDDRRATLDRLATRDLAALDGGGAISLANHISAYALRRTPLEMRLAHHLAAGQIREARGEYTAATHHYLAARQPALGVWTWFSHREIEIARGNAPAARAMFAEVAPGDLPVDDDRRALAVLQSELALMAGAADDAERALGAATWPAAHPAAAHARQLEGDLRQMQGRIEQALQAYRASIEAMSQPRERRMVQLHSKIGYIYVARLRDLEQARREGALALWQAHIFQGYVEEESGNYAAARRQYEAALEIASRLMDGRLALSRTRSYLGHLSWREGDAAAAIAHLQTALSEAHALGEPVSAIYNRLNLAGAYIVAGRHEEALAEAEAALSLAEPMQHAFLIAGLTASAGEACYYLGRLEQAERYALRSLREEEEVHRPYALTVLGWVRAAQGKAGEAESMLRMAIDSAQAAQDRYAEAPAWKALGRVLAGADRRKAAFDAFERARMLYEALALRSDAEAVHSEASQLP